MSYSGNAVNFGPIDKNDFENFQIHPDLKESEYVPVKFPDLAAIPKCQKYSYPEFNSLTFTLPAIGEWSTYDVDGLQLLSSLGIDQLTLNPVKWDKVKREIASGTVRYPTSNRNAVIEDGRHRTVALMKIYNLAITPCAVPTQDVKDFLINAEASGLKVYLPNSSIMAY
ncbi:hypothetical protein [Pantoea eucalypti]|jgi:hypothetical protein|uniref:hypothetical protein n=1 Tax=Pantoea eucalypti TaxID=470933 RepID=UPI00289694F6|nr:hypothetical protein [Pantoea eucalypti]